VRCALKTPCIAQTYGSRLVREGGPYQPTSVSSRVIWIKKSWGEIQGTRVRAQLSSTTGITSPKNKMRLQIVDLMQLQRSLHNCGRKNPMGNSFLMRPGCRVAVPPLCSPQELDIYFERRFERMLGFYSGTKGST
jgi:hypothetical protein